MLKEKLIRLTKYEISYYTNDLSDEDLPPLIFIHGNSSRKNIFNKILDSHYLQKHPFYIIDLPGHGESSWAADAEYDILYHAEAVKEFLSVLKIERPVLVGHSLGGHIAVKVSSMIETQGLVIFQAPPIEYLKDLSLAFNLIPEFNCLYVEKPSEKDWRSLLSLLSPDVEIQNEIAASFNRCDPNIRSRLGLSLSDPEACIGEISHLKNYSKPFLIIHGEDDPLVNLSYIKQFSFPLALIEKGGYYPSLSRASSFYTILEFFLKDRF